MADGYHLIVMRIPPGHQVSPCFYISSTWTSFLLWLRLNWLVGFNWCTMLLSLPHPGYIIGLR
jgi:hypothetical protein